MKDLINYHLSECWFTLLDNVSGSRSNRGLLSNRSLVDDPLWRLDFRTGLLQLEAQYEWSGFIKSLRGGFEYLTAYDVKRLYLAGYPNAKSPDDVSSGWDGTATVVTVGASGVLTLANLPANYIAKIGDRVGLEQGDYRGYYEIIENATANGDGDLVLTVTPLLHTRTFDDEAIARLWRPKAKFQIDWQSIRESGTREPSDISFQAYQVL